MAPSNQFELAGMLSASLKWNCPVAIRYPRGSCPEIESELESPLIEIGKSNLIKRGKKIALFGLGNMQQAAACVAKELEELFAISVSLIDPRFIKPIDEKLIMNLSKDHDIFITIEDHALQAGFGSALLEFISDYNLAISLKRFGVQDNFVSHASQSEQQYNNAYSKEQILAEVVELLSKTRENLAAN